MWIRSQNKRLLINIDVISVHNECDYYLVRGAGYELGTYYSKEKALKVLDEIQRAVGSAKIYSTNRASNGHSMSNEYVMVYQMPQDEDVQA